MPPLKKSSPAYRGGLTPPAGVSGKCAVRSRQRGYVMVVSLMILLLIAVASISMARSFFLEEGMAGFTREKNRSFAAAMAALRYGEFYAMTHVGVYATCPATGGQFSAQICSNAPTTPSLLINNSPMPSYMQVTPPSTYMTQSASGGQDTFYAYPGAYIYWMGNDQNGTPLFQITAFGYGGSQNSVSIVQSNYSAKCTTKNLTEGIASCQ